MVSADVKHSDFQNRVENGCSENTSYRFPEMAGQLGQGFPSVHY